MDSVAKSTVMDESKYNDAVFNSMDYTSTNQLLTDREFKQPSVKTWVYTNIDTDIWTEDFGIPFTATVNKDMFIQLKRYEKGVIIVKTIDFKLDNKTKYRDIMGQIFKNENIDNNLRLEIIEKIQSLIDRDVPMGSNENLRIVSFISEKDILNNVINVNGVSITNKKDLLFKTPNVIKAKSHTVDLSHGASWDSTNVILHYDSVSGDNIELDILGHNVIVGEKKDTIDDSLRGSDTVLVSISKRNTILIGDNLTRAELSTKGYLTVDEQSELFKDKDREHKDNIKDIFEKHVTANLTYDKFMYEHSVSLHKMFSFIIREEAAITSLQKEELSVAKEFLKLLPSG